MMTMKKSMKTEMKKRYSVPAKLVEGLFTDDGFFTEVIKLKKSSTFPKMDEWVDEAGFNMNFALAGYSPQDIEIKMNGNVIEIRSQKLEDERYIAPEPPKEDSPDLLQEYSKDVNTKIHKGYIIRGIARRGFDVKYLVSEEFNVAQAQAFMEHGLLHILIPNQNPVELNKTTVLKIAEQKV